MIKRKFAAEIRKEVIDGLLPERFNQAVRELGVDAGGPAAGDGADRRRRPAAAREGGVRVHSRFLDRRLPGRDGAKSRRSSVTEEEFQQELSSCGESRATIEPVEEDRALVDGDWAQITYTGQIEGDAEAAPIDGEDALVEIGGKDTVEAFTAALRGAKPGQELKAEVIYPAEYPEAKLAGKTVAYDS